MQSHSCNTLILEYVTCLLRLKTCVTVHVLLVYTLFGSEAATDSPVPWTHSTLNLAVKSEAETQSKQALLQQWNSELHHDEARPGRHQDSGSMWCTELQ